MDLGGSIMKHFGIRKTCHKQSKKEIAYLGILEKLQNRKSNVYNNQEEFFWGSCQRVSKINLKNNLYAIKK